MFLLYCRDVWAESLDFWWTPPKQAQKADYKEIIKVALVAFVLFSLRVASISYLMQF